MDPTALLTDEEMKLINNITERLGGDNWSLVTFKEEDGQYNAYSYLSNSNSLYKLIVIMREMILTVVNQMRKEISGVGSYEGHC